MKITLSADGISGKENIPAGEYLVGLGENGGINLTGGGHTINIPAVRRRTQARTRTTQVSFYKSGGRNWSLVVTTPKQGEWIAFVEIGVERRK